MTIADGPARAARCPDCRDGLDHCHGTLIVHHDLVVECTDAACTALDEVRHTLVIECGDTTPRCGCGGGDDDAP